ncbi:NAD+ synthase [Pleionea sp. CnH1-48]|uniref:NAD+ synthase n=1 Tax=Pleionea sp. CnH1-48 TaxID=2954494 RepID=UPI00209758EA|nr:NAD+ synthase [Pleionea sp. CnH1-48]MCO7225307.1 NAD+ synthase [Pleionea sp. CnH1-48]
MRIVLAQINPIVGDISGNASLIIEAIRRAKDELQPDVIVFPELAVCGYPPEDLLLRQDLFDCVASAIHQITVETKGVAIVLGHPDKHQNEVYNAASFIADGAILHTYHKQMLPNYSVFDEKRYFACGDRSCVFEYQGKKLGLVVCEDLWFEEPVAKAKAEGAEIILSPNASPYHHAHREDRLLQVTQRAKDNNLPVIYVNQVGGQDELVFDGRSLVIDASGDVVYEVEAFDTALACVEWNDNGWKVVSNEASLPQNSEEEMYRALVLGVKDYVTKNGFKGAVIGLSGGIDSALTLAVAVDALGAENVEAVMMPFRYTADMSIEDAQKEAELLGVDFDVVSIEPMYEAFMQGLASRFEGTLVDTTEQNLQARCRGTLLMAISNKSGRIVLTTGNKSEVAVGYSTLYGDMAGGFDVLKDVPKIWVYRLSRYRNTLSEVIPERVITRAPSAELAPDQKDEDSLPPYEILDAILEAYVVEDKSVADIVALGFEEDTIRHVMKMVDRNEYKRRQSAPGVRISRRAFGRDRRYPITSGFFRQL